MPDANTNERQPRGGVTGADWFDVWFSYGEANALLRVALRWAKENAEDQVALRHVLGRRQSVLAFKRAVIRLHQVVGVKSATRFKQWAAAGKKAEAKTPEQVEVEKRRVAEANRRARARRKERRARTGETWRGAMTGEKIEIDLPELPDEV